jgi:dTDP-4-dehydrorhamnose 3,5-epimerase
MTARVSPLAISGAWKIQANTTDDTRGSLSECFKDSDLCDATGYGLRVRQVNCSTSRRGALRGIKVTTGAPGQVKYVTCLRGAVLDVVVDLRVGSPTFGQWRMERLDEDNHTALYIGEGLGHAFLSLVDGSTVMYLLSENHNPLHEHSIHPLDPDLAITWPTAAELLLSPKDSSAPGLLDAQRAGLLPDYATCLAAADHRRPAPSAD